MAVKYYILDGDRPVAVGLLAWGEWFESSDRQLEVTILPGDGPEHQVRISTVFLGLDHNFSGVGPPVLWETMVFGGPDDASCRRYATAEAARDGHRELVAACRGMSPESH